MENDVSPSTQAMKYDDRFTVHNYTTGSFSAGPGSAELLSSAQRFIKAASTRYQKDQWRAVEKRKDFSWVPGKLYAYSRPPPEVVVQKTAPREDLKEWGTPVAEDEVWSLCELEEFESTAIGDTFKHRGARPSRKRTRSVETRLGTQPTRSELAMAASANSIPPPCRSQPESLEQGETVSSASKTKRPRLSEEASSAVPQIFDVPAAKRRRTDEGPLHGVIPRPHTFLTSMPSKSSQPASLKAYKRTVPIILAPYTSPLSEPSQWDRRAWIIPVRGTMPWERATAAAVLDDRGGYAGEDDTHVSDMPKLGVEKLKDFLKPLPPTPRTLEPVLWTRDALRSFWEYLKALRVDGKLGSMGMAFHAAPRYKDGSAPSTTVQGQGWAFDTPSQKSTAPLKQLEGVANESNGSLGLSSVDYIKVYHDAVQSMFLRTAIDIWQYEVRDDQGRSTDKIRVLKGAKLVLVDHLNEGVMIS